MKKSSIPYCKEMPNNWQEIPNRYLFEYHSKKVGTTWMDYQLLSLTTSGVKEKDINSSGGKVPDSYESYQTVEPGDMIFCLFDLDVSAVFSGLSHNHGMITSAYDVVKPNHKLLDQGFSDYWFQYVFSNRYYKMYSKNIRYTITSDMFKSIKTPIPPMSVQKSIAAFLNKKTSDIDSLIEIENQQIEKLKEYKQAVITDTVTKGLDKNVPMIDSGVDWIGKINEKYHLERLRFLVDIETGNQDTQNADANGAYPFYVRSPIIERNNNYSFEGPGILMAGDGAGAGRVFHYAEGKYAVHQRVYRFSNFKKINPILLKYYLESLFPKLMEYGSAQTTVPSVRLPMILNFQVVVQNNQEEILEYINKKCTVIDTLMTIKQQKIDVLKEYKKSLIYEYVTGKKEVG